MRGALILAFVVLTGTGGEIGLTHAMKRIGEVREFSPRAILRFIGSALREPWLWVSIGLMAVSFGGFLALLSWYPVSLVVPATSLAYVVGPLAAQFLLGERLNATRWTGVTLICFGVALALTDHTPSIPSAPLLHALLRDAIFVASAVPLAFYLFGAAAAAHFFGSAQRPAVLSGSHLINGSRQGAIHQDTTLQSTARHDAVPQNADGHDAARQGTASAVPKRPQTSGVLTPEVCGSGDFTPPVSILKPVHGLDRGAYENFASFCRQDYPEYEILFAASDESDPAVPVIRQVMRDFPNRSIRLLLGVEKAGANNKVAKLCGLVTEARHDLLVISDSDVRVPPGYLRGVVAPFADDRVGAVTALYRAIEAPTFGAVMDAVGASASFAGSALVARSLEGLQFAMGSTMATTRQRLEEIGGFSALLDLHSDDYEFGRRIAALGYRVELAREPVDMQFPSETLGGYLRHELRWLVGIRHIRPGGHFGILMTQGLAWAVAAALVAPSTALGAIWIGAYLIVRLATGYVVGVWGLGDPVLRRKLWLLPLHDFFMFFTWLASFAVNRIEWRGLIFTLDKGRLIPVAPRSGRE